MKYEEMLIISDHKMLVKITMRYHLYPFNWKNILKSVSTKSWKSVVSKRFLISRRQKYIGAIALEDSINKYYSEQNSLHIYAGVELLDYKACSIIS